MAEEVRHFAPTIPAGTPIGAGWSADLSFPARTVDRVDVKVPPGPRGTVGFYLGSAGVPIIPTNGEGYIVTDDQSLSFDLTGQITSGAWALYGYNTGVNPHTIYVTFHLSLPQTKGAAYAPDVTATAGLTFGYH